MSLRLRQLKLRIVTSDGLYGVTIPFEDGLVIIRADNSTGKSTCIQAIIYALGLERMLGPSSDVPLPHVMTEYIEDDGAELHVLESDVFLEICNERGEVMTIQRTVKGERDRRLISTWDGSLLSNPTGQYQQRDLFVRDPGAATHPYGFHHHLASFIGWELPAVTKFDGSECSLYMETIFPLMIVEQKHGWGGIQSNLPTFFGIKEVAKRAIEFLAGLEAYELAVKRQRLSQEESNLKQKWKVLLAECEVGIRSIGGTINAPVADPTAEWPPEIVPHIGVFREGMWFSLQQAIRADKDLLAGLKSEDVPTVEQAADGASEELQEAKEILKEKQFLLSTLFEEVRAEKSQLETIDIRLEALEEDLRRNRDIDKLKKFGSVAGLDITSGTCPTCHQPVVDSLLPHEALEDPMSIDENITFINSQKFTFTRMRINTVRVLDAKEKQLISMRAETDEVRARIRALKQTLISDGRTPSTAAIYERILVEERIRLAEKIEEDFDLHLDRFSDLASEWKSIQERKSELPKKGLSQSDKDKLNRLQRSFIEQVKQYGLSSVKPDSLEISEDNYKPTLEGFNLGFDLSASDNIRTIWAYLQGLLELSRDVETNHLGLLILDEPRQQETAEFSFAEFLKRASGAARFRQQVIFATSETEANLREILIGVPHTCHRFAGKIIKRQDD